VEARQLDIAAAESGKRADRGRDNVANPECCPAFTLLFFRDLKAFMDDGELPGVIACVIPEPVGYLIEFEEIRSSRASLRSMAART
jgi:hypothetical protein